MSMAKNVSLMLFKGGKRVEIHRCELVYFTLDWMHEGKVWVSQQWKS